MRTNYKLDFSYEGVHNCDAMVLTCIDFRFWREVSQFIDENLKIKDYDFPKFPGSAKAINEAEEGDVVMNTLNVCNDLHHVNKFVIVNHSDCGAYGGSAKFKGDLGAEEVFHIEELKKTEAILKDRFPGKEVLLVYAKLVDNTKLSFNVVE